MNQAEVLCHSSGPLKHEYFAEVIAAKENSLEHHGVLGQKWGIRRYQNKDGSLTAEGKKRAAEGAEGVSKVLKKGQADARNIRIAGKVKGLAAYTTSTIGGTAAGGALGSTAGPAGTIAGATTGGLAGAAAGRAANALIRMHANEKANALSQEYQLLGQKMMEEYSNKKVRDVLAKEYEKDYSDWVDAHDNFQRDSKSKNVRDAEKKADDKQFESYSKLKDAGATDKDISKIHDEVLKAKNKKKN